MKIPKRFFVVLTVLMVLFTLDYEVTNAQDEPPKGCANQYVQDLRKDGYTIEEVVFLPAKTEDGSKISIRFIQITENEKKVITADLHFDDMCNLTDSEVLSTIYLKRKDDGQMSFKTRYSISEASTASRVSRSESGG